MPCAKKYRRLNNSDARIRSKGYGSSTAFFESQLDSNLPMLVSKPDLPYIFTKLQIIAVLVVQCPFSAKPSGHSSYRTGLLSQLENLMAVPQHAVMKDAKHYPNADHFNPRCF